MTFQEFLEKYNGQQNVGNTTENKGECVGLVMKWVEELGLPHIWGHAKDLFANADEDFYEKILNTPDAIPKAGDIVVLGSGYGTYGHTAIATGTGDLKTLECFSQNDPLESNCHLKTYKYDHVTGWLRPKVSQNDALNNELRAQRDTNWNLYQQEREAKIALETQIDQKNKTILVMEKRIEDKDGEIKSLSESLQSLVQKNTDLGNEVVSLKADKQKAEMDLEICLAKRKDLAKYTSKELRKELFHRFIVYLTTFKRG